MRFLVVAQLAFPQLRDARGLAFPQMCPCIDLAVRIPDLWRCSCSGDPTAAALSDVRRASQLRRPRGLIAVRPRQRFWHRYGGARTRQSQLGKGRRASTSPSYSGAGEDLMGADAAPDDVRCAGADLTPVLERGASCGASPHGPGEFVDAGCALDALDWWSTYGFVRGRLACRRRISAGRSACWARSLDGVRSPQ
jgi:hypothetical protein